MKHTFSTSILFLVLTLGTIETISAATYKDLLRYETVYLPHLNAQEGAFIYGKTEGHGSFISAPRSSGQGFKTKSISGTSNNHYPYGQITVQSYGGSSYTQLNVNRAFLGNGLLYMYPNGMRNNYNKNGNGWDDVPSNSCYISANHNGTNKHTNIVVRTYNKATGYLNHIVMRGEKDRVATVIQTPLQARKGILTNEVEVTTDTWPDYVFDAEYTLTPLDELDSYLKTEQHLPGIPSEKEIKENGLGLKDMTTRQMEKIEELTLYTIQQHKQIADQNSRITQLEEQLQQVLSRLPLD